MGFCAPEQVAPLNGVCWRMVCLVVTQGRGPVKWVRVLFLTPEQRAPLNGVVACVRAWTPWVGHVPRGYYTYCRLQSAFSVRGVCVRVLHLGVSNSFGILLLFLFVLMATEAWTRVMEAALLPEPAQKRLVELGYVSQDTFQFKDESTLEDFIQHFLREQLKVENLTDKSWAFHPMCGILRRLWRQAGGVSGTDTALLKVPSPASAAAGTVNLFAGACSKSLTVADRDQLRRDLEKKCSGTLVTLNTLPAMSLLNLVQAQKLQGAYDWIPWKKLLSEKAASLVKGRKPVDVKDRFVEALAFGVGLCDEEWDREIPAAPYRVHELLQVRANCYAMVGACHLGNWALYAQKFMEFYTMEPGTHCRYPNIQEAEDADQAALREVFRLCYGGATLDDALATVAIDRDMLRQLLQPRPKLLQAAKGDREPLKRKKGAKPEAASGTGLGECFLWRRGKCNRANCKFNHACGNCGATDHCAKECVSHKEKKARMSRQAVE